MGTTSDKLTYLATTKDKLKTTINYTGANITNDTFRSYPEKLYNQYVDLVTNGTDTLYSNLPKVSASNVESATLNNTKAGKMELTYKGNTQQNSTTGKNLLPNSLTSQTLNNVTVVVNSDGTIKLNGTSNAITWLHIDYVTLEAGTYTLSQGNTDNVTRLYSDMSGYTSGGIKTFTLTETTTKRVSINIPNNTTLNNLVIKPMIESGSSATPYEPYTGNRPSPSPDYPQDIHIVSGDNTIEICGKNLFDKDNANVLNTYINDENNTIISSGKSRTIYIQCDKNTTYTISKINATARFVVGTTTALPGNNVSCNNVIANNSATSITITTGVNDNYLCAFIYHSVNDSPLILEDVLNMLQIEKGETSSEYEAYKGQSQLISLGVENLWKNQITGFLPQSGAYPTTNSTYPNARYVLINLLKGQSITLSNSTSGDGRVRCIDKDTNQVVGSISANVSEYYTSTGNFQAKFDNGTITAKKDFIVGILDLSGSINALIVNYGTKPQTISDNPIELNKIGNYQDYIYKTDKWYLHKEIGKVVLDGTQEVSSYAEKNTATYYCYWSPAPNDIKAIQNETGILLCNYFSEGTWSDIYSKTNDTQIIALRDNKRFYFRTSQNTSSAFQTWQTTNNLIVYYPLATPTNTEITDYTLYTQLEAIKSSYENQTNISQTNNDLPFILDVKAIKEI